jgi:mannose-6-phosphate isomerase-like protein (cupin superfamily)
MGQKAVVSVADITAFPAEARHNNCSKGIMHADDHQESSVYRVKPGGFVPSHLHSRVYDLFIGVQGQVDITYEGQQGDGCVALKPGAFCSMPPGVRHEVRNNSSETEAVFILVHAPNSGYDFIPVDMKRSAAAAMPTAGEHV